MLKQPKVLLVEDNDIARKAQTMAFQSHQLSVDVAKNGKEAIEKANGDYDVIILDIRLPDMTGVDICKTIRARKNDPHTPIIALTAFGEIVKNECEKAGFDDFYTKPLLPEMITKILSSWIPDHDQKLTTVN
jgi:CheY-like chemotaxis protein